MVSPCPNAHDEALAGKPPDCERAAAASAWMTAATALITAHPTLTVARIMYATRTGGSACRTAALAGTVARAFSVRPTGSVCRAFLTWRQSGALEVGTERGKGKKRSPQRPSDVWSFGVRPAP